MRVNGSIGMIANPNTSRSIFICYAHQDNEGVSASAKWLDRLLQILTPLIRQDELSVWSDKEIKIGDHWQDKIQENLDRAKAVILLVSPAFLASDYVAKTELPLLLMYAREFGTRIFPVIISPCLYEEATFRYPDFRTGPNRMRLADIQSANPPSKTLSEMTEPEQNRVFMEVCRAARQALNEA